MLEMRSATEVALVYTVNGTNVTAGTAAYAFLVINSSEVVYNGYSSDRTGLLTLSAGYTTVFAEFSHVRALFLAVAFNNNARGIVYKMYYVVRADFLAKSAADALSRVNLGNAALGDAYSISRAYLGAIAVSEAGILTVSVARIAHIRRLTGLRADVFVLLFLGRASAVAGNVSDLLDNLLRLSAEYFGNLLRNTVTAWGAEVGFYGSTVAKSLCVTVAS